MVAFHAPTTSIEYHPCTAAAGGGQFSTLIVVIPGHTNSGNLLVQAGQPDNTLLTELRSRGQVGVVNRVGPSFSFEEEAREIVDFIDAHHQSYPVDRLVLIGHSMGGRVATSVLDELKNHADLADRLGEAFVITACAAWEKSDFYHPRVMKLMAVFCFWPPSWNLVLGPLLDRLSPKYTAEPGHDEHVKAHRKFMSLYPNLCRRRELKAMLRASGVQPRIYAGHRLVVISAQHDGIVRTEAAKNFLCAFDTGTHLNLAGASHGTWPEQPLLWTTALVNAIDSWTQTSG